MSIDLVRDFSIAGLLLLSGFWLRSKLPLLQRLFIPSAVVAGFLGLLLGPEVLGRFSPVCIRFSPAIEQMALPLLAIVFCTQFIGASFGRKLIRSALSTCRLNCGTAFLQVLVGLVFTLVFICLRSKVPLSFGLMPFTGFYGGHGIPMAVAGPLDAAGLWSQDLAMSVGNTFATVGMLFGISCGILIINLGARRGIFHIVPPSQRKESDSGGLLPPELRTEAVSALTRSDNVNPLAFHIAIILAILWASYLLLDLLTGIPTLSNLSITVPAVVVGGLTAFLGKVTPLGNYLDRKSLSSLSGAALEFLIVTSIATTKLHVLADYGVELLFLSAATAAITCGYVFFFGRRWHRDHWLQNSLGTFGLATGILATGFLLIRMADPENRTGAAANLTVGNALSTMTVQGFLLTFLPLLFSANPLSGFIIAAAGLILCTLCGCFLFRRKNHLRAIP